MTEADQEMVAIYDPQITIFMRFLLLNCNEKRFICLKNGSSNYQSLLYISIASSSFSSIIIIKQRIHLDLAL